MALRASISACVSLCASMRMLQKHSTAGVELHAYLYVVESTGTEEKLTNNTLLEEKLATTFGGQTLSAENIEFTVITKQIVKHSGLVVCDITWTESSGTYTQEMVKTKTGVVGENVPLLAWVGQDEGMKKTTFNFNSQRFNKIPDSDDDWKGLIRSSTAGLENTEIVINKIVHAGIDFDRLFFATDVFWSENKNEQQSSYFHDDNFLMLSGEDVQIKKLKLEFDLLDAVTTMPTNDGGWEAWIANMADVKHVPFWKITQKGLNNQKTKFDVDVFWVGNDRGSAVDENSDHDFAVMVDDVTMKTSTFSFRRDQFTTIPSTDDEWKDVIVNSNYGIEKFNVIIGGIRPVGIDLDRTVFHFDVVWCDKTWKQPKSTRAKRSVFIHDDDERSWVDKELQVTAVHFAVSDVTTTMPTTLEEWEVLIKNMKAVTNVNIVKVIQNGLNDKKTTFGCDVFWV